MGFPPITSTIASTPTAFLLTHLGFAAAPAGHGTAWMALRSIDSLGHPGDGLLDWHRESQEMIDATATPTSEAFKSPYQHRTAKLILCHFATFSRVIQLPGERRLSEANS